MLVDALFEEHFLVTNAELGCSEQKGIRMPGSKEDYFLFPKFYRIPCMVFPSFDGEYRLVY